MGCRVQGSGFRVQDFGFRVTGLGCRVQGLGCEVQGLGCRVQDSGSEVRGLEFGVQVSEFVFSSFRTDERFGRALRGSQTGLARWTVGATGVPR